MAKFVSAATAAGATGVGAGHGYMGPSNIHVGFGNPATWGGAPWIKSAAAGVYNNQDMGGGSYGAGEYGGGGNMMGGFAGMGNMAGMDPLSMMMGGGFPLGGMMGMNPFSILGAGLPGLIGGAFSALVSGLGSTGSSENNFSENEIEENVNTASPETKEADDFRNTLNYSPMINNADSVLDYIKTTAIDQQTTPQIIQQAPSMAVDQTMPIQRQPISGQGTPFVVDTMPSWVRTMAGRIDYSREMNNYVGGVLVKQT